MNYNIYKRDGQHYCKAVNPYPMYTGNLNPEWLKFNEANPELAFIHPSPETLPDIAIVSGEDLGEVFLTRYPCKNPDELYPCSYAISFKNPEQMHCIDGVFVRKEQGEERKQSYSEIFNTEFDKIDWSRHTLDGVIVIRPETLKKHLLLLIELVTKKP